MSFWFGDRNGWRHQIRERFGYDPLHAPISDVFGSIVYILHDRAQTGFGVLREAAPTAPQFCDFAAATDPHEAHRDAMKAWELGVCSLDRWTSSAEVDAGLMTKRGR